MEKEVTINIDSEALNQLIEKANRLVALLREVQQIVYSLRGEENSEA